jgi:hypothetical protein
MASDNSSRSSSLFMIVCPTLRRRMLINYSVIIAVRRQRLRRNDRDCHNETSRQQTLFCDRESLQEWEVTLKTSNTRAGKFPLTISKIMMTLIFISLIGSTFIAPAFGRDNRRQGYNDGYRYEHGRRVYQPPRHYYPVPVYLPPPVIYGPYPYQSPGISIIFPIHIR